MLVLWDLVKLGQLPLLGPETLSIANSNLHHGAFYWYLLAPAALVSGASPVAVVFELAFLGIAAVGATWWAARTIGGPVVALVAGLLMAVSPAAIEQSIFVWNPNPIPLFAAVSLGAAWQAHRTGLARWYAIAIGAAVAVFQLHLLGVIFVLPVMGLVAADLLAAVRLDRARLPGVLRGTVGGAAVGVVLVFPLLVSELQTGFAETRQLLTFLGHGGVGQAGTLDLTSAIAFVAFRAIGWPFVGLVTDVPVPAAIAVAVSLTLLIWSLVVARGGRRLALAWLAAILAFSIVTLARFAPGLQTVVAALPTDHYHAFLNPVICIALALAGVTLVERARRSAGPSGRVLGGLFAALLVVGLGVSLVRAPSPSDVATWPEARDTASQVLQLVGDRTLAVVGLPDFKPADGIAFPLTYLGGRVSADGSTAEALVVSCDARFTAVMPAPCGGPAEDAAAAGFVAGSGRTAIVARRISESAVLLVSVYTLSD